METLGYVVGARPPRGSTIFGELRRRPPAAVVISLDRLPSAGRDIACGLRAQKSTAAIPLVFVGGVPAKVAAVRATLPQAVFATWPKVGPALRRALTQPRATHPAAAVISGGVMAAYAGTPLPRKLGIKPGMRVALLRVPPGFASVLGALPPGVRLTGPCAGADLVLWFVRSRADFDRDLPRTAPLAGLAPLWVVSPKKSGPLAADISQNQIRAGCLAAGLVDYKVCAVDAAWSGLLFRRREPALQNGSPKRLRAANSRSDR